MFSYFKALFKYHGKSSNMCFLQFVRPPGRELLPHRGWDVDEEANRDQQLFHPLLNIWYFFIMIYNICFDFRFNWNNEKQARVFPICSPPGRELLPHWGCGWGGEEYHQPIEWGTIEYYSLLISLYYLFMIHIHLCSFILVYIF